MKYIQITQEKVQYWRKWTRYITFISRETLMSWRKNTLYKVRRYKGHVPHSHKTYDSRYTQTCHTSKYYKFYSPVTRWNRSFVITWFVDWGGVLCSVQFSWKSVSRLHSVTGGCHELRCAVTPNLKAKSSTFSALSYEACQRHCDSRLVCQSTVLG